LRIYVAFSDFGGVLFPTLAEFCFRLWRSFVSDFGGVLFPTLAVFCFRLWRFFTSDFGGMVGDLLTFELISTLNF
jgi:hypothetical protein